MSSTPTPINYGKIIILVIIVGGFIACLVLLRNTLNKNCSSGEVYDNKLGCIKDCSSIPNTHFSTETKNCVSNCSSDEKDCGGICYSADRNQQCLTDENGNSYVCKLNQTLCGGICMNNDQSCVGGKIYDSSQVCDSNPDKPIICDNVSTQCDKVNKVCVKCEKGRVLCNGVCCSEKNFCNSDGTCVACDPTTTTVCGKHCCTIGSLCSSDKSKCITCSTSLCNDKCLDSNQVCTNDGPCDPLNVYKQGDITHCCEKSACKGVCCDTNQSCQDDKCMDICGSSFCDPETQKCVVVDNKSYCINKGCEWDEIIYDPQSIKYGTKGQQLEICGLLTNGVPTYWATKHQNITRTAKDIQASSSKAQCNTNDCIYRTAEKGLNTVEFDTVSKTCNSLFNCSTLLPDTLTTCPLDNTKSCCTDATGTFTGQVCPGNEVCDNGVCHVKCGDGQYYSNDKGKCLALNRFTDTPVNQKWFVTDKAALVRFNRNYTGCTNGVVNRFYMPTDAEQNYTYTCTNSDNVDNANITIKNLNADLQKDGKADKYVGMTQNLQCDPSSALSNFFLHGEIDGRSPPDTISSNGPYTADGTGDDINGNFYTIQCKHIPDLTDCKKMTTAPRSVLHPAGNWWEGQFGIAGHDVNCNIGNENADNKYVLTGWNYVQDGDYSYHINYNCCRVDQSKV